MNERIQALRGRLPNGVLSVISKYDCHPTADLMKAVSITRWGRRGGVDISVAAPHYMITHDSGRIRSRGFLKVKHSSRLANWVVEEYVEEPARKIPRS